MGQQQLLLLVVGVVLVGIAVVAAFPIMQKSQRQDEADGLLDRGLTLASHAVYWRSSTYPYRAGGQSYALLATRGIAELGSDDATIRGEYAITDASDDFVEITGVSTRYPEVGIRVYVNDFSIDSSRIDFAGAFSLDARPAPPSSTD